MVQRGDQHIYKLQLILEDATGQLPALIYENDGAEFFHGVPAVDLRSNNVSYRIIQSKFKALFQQGAWLNVCIKKYKSEAGNIKYRIFGTSIRA